MAINASMLQDLASLNLTSEQLSGVLRIISTFEAREDDRKSRDRERKIRNRSKDSPRKETGHSMETDGNGTGNPSSRVVDNITTTSKEVSKKEPPNPPLDFFDTSFWPIYPRKVGKGGARRAFKAACLKTSPETIVEAARRFAGKCVGKDDKFIPHPATWLGDERWQDAELAPQQQSPECSSGIYVQYGTEQGDAWEHYFRTVRKRVPPRDRNNGWWFPTEFPTQSPDRSAA